MGKRGRILIALMAVAILGTLAWTILHGRSSPPEPVFEGKPLSYWIDQLAGDQNTDDRANQAVSQIGTHAYPYLLQMLRAHDSPLKARLLSFATQHRVFHIDYTPAVVINIRARVGFTALGPQAIGAIPGLIKVLDENVSSESEWITAATLADIGPEARAAVPSLIRAAASTNEVVRINALFALGRIHADPDKCVPILVKALSDPSAVVRANVAFGLQTFGSDAKAAIPTLVALLNDPNINSNSSAILPGGTVDVRRRVIDALREIDPATYSRVMTNDTANSNY